MGHIFHYHRSKQTEKPQLNFIFFVTSTKLTRGEKKKAEEWLQPSGVSPIEQITSLVLNQLKLVRLIQKYMLNQTWNWAEMLRFKKVKYFQHCSIAPFFCPASDVLERISFWKYFQVVLETRNSESSEKVLNICLS